MFQEYHLETTYYRHTSDQLLEQFNGYYGGNTHAYGRGLFKNYYYYDFNSLYPSVMINKYPDPNSLRITKKNDTGYIDQFEGVSNVDIYCPYMHSNEITKSFKETIFI